MKASKYIYIVLSLSILINSFLFILPTTTFAEPKSKDKENELKTFQNQLDEADIASPVEREKIEKIGENEVRFEGKDKKVKIDLKNKKIKINEKEDLHIELSSELNYEQVDDKILGYDSEGNLQNSIENVGGGFRMVINITKTNKKNYSYDFPLIAKNGEKYMEKETGEFWLVNEKGERLYIVMKPWANDSTGKSLKTWYTIEKKGTVLRQNIDLKDASFPVVADPTWCGYTVDNINWESRGDEGGWTLSVHPTWCGRYYAFASTIWYEVIDSNAFIKALYSTNNPYVVNSLYQQFICHRYGGFYKEYWNLEPWRQSYPWNYGLMTTPSAVFNPFYNAYGWQCNPPKY